jgi:hypothetical protein
LGRLIVSTCHGWLCELGSNDTCPVMETVRRHGIDACKINTRLESKSTEQEHTASTIESQHVIRTFNNQIKTTSTVRLTVFRTIQLNAPRFRLSNGRSFLILLGSSIAQITGFAILILSHTPNLELCWRGLLLAAFHCCVFAKDGVQSA